MAENTIKWDKDADGIVTLTLDDPTGSANVMNEHYTESMHNAVERLVAEKDSITGVVITSAKKTFFAGGDLKGMIKAQPEDAGEFFSTVEGDQGRPAHAGDPRQARRRRHQRRRARRRPGDRAGVPPPHHRRRAGRRRRLPRGDAGPAARWRRRHPHGADVRHPERVHERAVPGHPVQARARPRRPASSTRCCRPSRNWCPPPRRGSRPTPTAIPSRGMPKGYKMPGGTPSSPALAGILPSFPALLKKQLKGAPMPAPRAILDAAVEGAQVDFDTASRIESRYFTSSGHRPGREEHDPGVLLRPADITGGGSRPEGIGQDADHQDRRARRGHDGRRHRVRVGQGRLRRRAQGRLASRPREKGKDYSEKLEAKALERGKTTEEKSEALLARITPTADAADFEGVDFVIEAVFENQ